MNALLMLIAIPAQVKAEMAAIQAVGYNTVPSAPGRRFSTNSIFKMIVPPHFTMAYSLAAGLRTCSGVVSLFNEQTQQETP
jgi:hypothetical protein